jgi:hypothetical protein
LLIKTIVLLTNTDITLTAEAARQASPDPEHEEKMSEMLGPAYAIPILRKSANHELRKYVKAEFNDDECHWFTCGSRTIKAENGSTLHGTSLVARLRRPRREPASEPGPTLVPCAVMLSSCRDDEHCHSAADK